MTHFLPRWSNVRTATSAVAAAMVVLLPTKPCAAADKLTMLAPTVTTPHPPLIVLMHSADEKDMIGLW